MYVKNAEFGWSMPCLAQSVSFLCLDPRSLAWRSNGARSVRNVGGREVNVGIPEAVLKSALQMAPFGRGALTEEAASTVAVLCYLEASHINGQIIDANGGQGLN